MEHYSFKCGSCNCSYNYVGFKTGIGKTEAQLKQMRDETHICRHCEYDDREGEKKSEQSLDMVDNASSDAAAFAASLFAPKDP